MRTGNRKDQIWKHEGGKTQDTGTQDWHYPPSPLLEDASRAVTVPPGRGGWHHRGWCRIGTRGTPPGRNRQYRVPWWIRELRRPWRCREHRRPWLDGLHGLGLGPATTAGTLLPPQKKILGETNGAIHRNSSMEAPGEAGGLGMASTAMTREAAHPRRASMDTTRPTAKTELC